LLVLWWLLVGPLAVFKATLLVDEFHGLITAILIFSFLLSSWLYVSARFRGIPSSGNFLWDFWLGLELNPELFGVDLKLFALKPAMMGWTMINLSVAAKEWDLLGGHLSPSMVVYQLLSFIYVFDYFWFEPLMLSTWDIIAEHWGFMLVFGDLWWIPIVFSLQSWAILSRQTEPSALYLVIAVVVFIVGYFIFRFGNLQKDAFKANSRVVIWGRPAEALDGRLLVSGLWGWLRKPNYLGDLLIALSFSLPCGSPFTAAPVAYAYPTYLLILLIHRQWRDDRRCAQKYGALWKKYTERVPYAIIPGIY